MGFRNPHPVSLDYAESGLELQVYPSYLTILGENKKKKKKDNNPKLNHASQFKKKVRSNG